MNYTVNNDVITATLTNGSCRIFRTSFPKKFNIHGFGSMNVIETLLPKLSTVDYSYCVTDTSLELGFTISNTKKETHYALHLEEVFDPIDLNLVSLDMKPHFMCLQNQINFLKSKLTTLIEENESLKHKDYYDYC